MTTFVISSCSIFAHKHLCLITCGRSGELVRLEHVLTGRNVHSHRHQAPINTYHYQVSYQKNGLHSNVFKVDFCVKSSAQNCGENDF